MLGGRCCRRGGARAGELAMREGPPGDGDHSCVLEEARGGVGLPESSSERRRTVGGVERNCRSLVAPVGWRPGAKREEREAINTAWSRREINAALRRIQSEKSMAATAGRVQREEEEDDVAWGRLAAREREGVRGPSASVCVGHFASEKMFRGGGIRWACWA